MIKNTWAVFDALLNPSFFRLLRCIDISYPKSSFSMDDSCPLKTSHWSSSLNSRPTNHIVLCSPDFSLYTNNNVRHSIPLSGNVDPKNTWTWDEQKWFYTKI
jgi:hypothetical protein